jgi:tripartite-type tricarboxylate transporter receptor subunit TctC
MAARHKNEENGRAAVLDRLRVSVLAIELGLCLVGGPALAQDFPARPVTIIVPQPPGGGTDIIARIVGDQLSRQLGQAFIIENRAGAGTAVGTAAAAEAAPDGYTLLTGLNANMAVNPSLFAKLPYDPIRDFSPVAMLAEYPFAVVVSKSLPANSIKELIELARSRPGQINYASAGNGTGQHLSTELFKLMTGVDLTHVPYRGAAPAYADVISGQVPVFFDNLSSALGQIKSGNVRVLAVTGRERSPLLPDVPTVREAGVSDYQYYVWFGLWAPRKTPEPIIEKLHAAVEEALADPTIKQRIVASAGVPSHMPIGEIEPFVKAEIVRWADVVKRAGIVLQ